MVKNVLYSTILLTVVWIILREDYTIITVTSGLFISAFCVYFCYRFLPMQGMPEINFFGLLVYLVYLLTQVYLSGISVIKIILTEASVEIVQVKTQITDKFLRAILVNSITLVPGSISLDLQEDTITVLWLKKKTIEKYIENPDEQIKGKLERMLLKTQK